MIRNKNIISRRKIVKVVLRKRQKPIQKKKVSPVRLPNKTYREREHLTEKEINNVTETAQTIGRHGLRDSTMVLMCYRHGLRLSELLNLKWDQINFELNLLEVVRINNSMNSTHPLYSAEVQALAQIKKKYKETQFVFVTERKKPLSPSTFRKIIARAGKKALLDMPIHPHMLRHSAGFKLANDGHNIVAIQHYLGHKNISHTVQYFQFDKSDFRKFWD